MNSFLIMLGFFVVLADQLTKYVVESLLYVGQSIPIIPQYFHITLVRNPGAMFGLMAHWRWFFIVVTIAALTILVLFMKDISGEVIYAKIGLVLIMSGAVGNLIDRL
ncbi:MAG: signal peptidase II, partial [Firmicutes bacterium HGW-Firmicutes-13]